MLRVAIQQAIYDTVVARAALGDFMWAKYDGKTGRAVAPTSQASPATIRVNAIREAIQPDETWRRSFRQERTAMTFSLVLKFNKEAVCDKFTDFLLDSPITIREDTDSPTSHTYLAALESISYTEPPQHQASNGSEVEYTFTVAKLGR